MHSGYVQIAPEIHIVRKLHFSRAPAVLYYPCAVLLRKMRLSIPIRVIGMIQKVSRLYAVIPSDYGYGMSDHIGLICIMQPLIALCIQIFGRFIIPLSRKICVRCERYRNCAACHELPLDRIGSGLIVSVIYLCYIVIFVNILGLIKYSRIRKYT